MGRLLSVYSYAAPLALLPLSYWLWWRQSGGDHRFVLIVLSMPILFAYVVPGLGTNWLRLWEFHTRWRLGRFRPHHGFVFGTATSLLALVCVGRPAAATDAWEVVRAAFVTGSVLAFWNWLYDTVAIRAGLIVVYNRPYSQDAGPEAIAADYAPVYFGAFGACYGAAVAIGRYAILEQHDPMAPWLLAIGGNLAVLVIPVVAFVAYQYLRTGTAGLSPCYRKGE